MSILNNSQSYNVNLENGVTELLSHFETDFVLDVVQYNVLNRIKYTSLPTPNLCSAYEQSFKTMLDDYPASREQISLVRSRTFNEIIEQLCAMHNMRYNTADIVDPYAGAFYLYKFLVCDFQQNLQNFFVNILLREKIGILTQLGLMDENNIKKIKDKATLFNGVTIFKDPYITLLSANLSNAIPLLTNMDISLVDIINTVSSTDINYRDFLLNSIADTGDFYRDQYIRTLTDPVSSPFILGSLRLALHEAGTITMGNPLEVETNE